MIRDPHQSRSVLHRAELEAIVGAFFSQRTAAENLAYFEERGITVGPICDISDLMAHPYIQGRGVVKDYADPEHGTLPACTFLACQRRRRPFAPLRPRAGRTVTMC